MSKKQDLNFEINILPILDILSVLICFLLLTAVWVQVGTLDTKQAVGDNSSVSSGKNPPSLWVTMEENGTIKMQLRDVGSTKNLDATIGRTRQGVNWAAFAGKVKELKAQWPDLKTSVIQPQANTSYGDVIKAMDQLKQEAFEGVGISPLG